MDLDSLGSIADTIIHGVGYITTIVGVIYFINRFEERIRGPISGKTDNPKILKLESRLLWYKLFQKEKRFRGFEVLTDDGDICTYSNTTNYFSARDDRGLGINKADGRFWVTGPQEVELSPSKFDILYKDKKIPSGEELQNHRKKMEEEAHIASRKVLVDYLNSQSSFEE